MGQGHPTGQQAHWQDEFAPAVGSFASWAGLAALGRMPKEGCIMHPIQEILPTIAAGAGCNDFRSAFDDPQGNQSNEREGSVLEIRTACPLPPEDEWPVWWAPHGRMQGGCLHHWVLLVIGMFHTEAGGLLPFLIAPLRGKPVGTAGGGVSRRENVPHHGRLGSEPAATIALGKTKSD